jgi:threonine aldolase
MLHLDGARVFNAAVALSLDVKELTRHVDSLSFCLSKGLSAPVGSVICGSKEFVAEARRIRKSVGGGMRQCGIIAAAGIEALNNMTTRLAEDHANARRLAEGIAEIPGLVIDLDRVQTNIVFFDIVSGMVSAEQLVKELYNEGVRILQLGPARMRAVTHYGIEIQDIESALTALSRVMRQQHA